MFVYPFIENDNDRDALMAELEWEIGMTFLQFISLWIIGFRKGDEELFLKEVPFHNLN